MDYYKCDNCGVVFDEFYMNYAAAQIDKKTLCRKCREINDFEIIASGEVEVRNSDNLADIFERFFSDITKDEYYKAFDKIEKYKDKQIEIGIRVS